MTQQIPTDAGGVFIGECTVGNCGRPATVTMGEDYILCSLHTALITLGEDQDEMSLAVELMTGWRGLAKHHHNQYLVRLLSAALEDCQERLDRMELVEADLRETDKENIPSEEFRMSLRSKPKDEDKIPSMQFHSLLSEAAGIVGAMTVPEKDHEELVNVKRAIAEAHSAMSVLTEGSATAAEDRR